MATKTHSICAEKRSFLFILNPCMNKFTTGALNNTHTRHRNKRPPKKHAKRDGGRPHYSSLFFSPSPPFTRFLFPISSLLSPPLSPLSIIFEIFPLFFEKTHFAR
eukprot:GEMP01093259.1.p1 GENE.GEMP01093259.1~~GEMP01093259.1.p1  ORF type:complete len:105 (+),score=5.16 GEMP01093259.1:508-822(+)